MGEDYLAALEYQQSVVVWDMDTWSIVRTWDNTDCLDGDYLSAPCIALSSDDTKVVVPHKRLIAVLNVDTGGCSSSDPASDLEPDEDCDWNPTANVWLGSDDGDSEGFDLYSGPNHCRRVDTIDGVAKGVAWSPNVGGSWVAYTYRDYSVSPSRSTLRIRTAPTCSSSGTVLATIALATGAIAGGVTWSPDAQCVAAIDGDGGLRIFSHSGGTCPGHPSAIALPNGFHGAVSWSPDGNHIAVYGDSFMSGLWVYDAHTGLEVANCIMPTDLDNLDSIGWRSDGQVLVGTSPSGNVVYVFAPFDAESPTLTVTSPSNGAVVYESVVAVSGFTSDNLDHGLIPDSLWWQIDSGGWVAEPYPTSGGAFALSVPVDLGLHVIAIRVQDLAGHETIQSIQVERREPPWIVVAGVTNTAILQGATTTIWATVSDGGSFATDATVTAELQAPDGGPINLPMAYVTANSRYETPLVCTLQGTYSGSVRASRMGMADGAAPLPDIAVANAPPSTTITSSYPTEGQHIGQTPLTMSWIGTDTGTPSGSLVYSWKLDSANWSSYSCETGTTLSGLNVGAHSFSVKACDGSLEDPSPAVRSFFVEPDCNLNGIPDQDDIAGGQSEDCNGNGTPDECESDLGPEIFVPPASQSAFERDSVEFQVEVTGSGALMYQWRHDGQPLTDGAEISGSHTALLHINAVTPEFEGIYDVLVEDDCDVTLSQAAVLTVYTIGDLNCDGIFNLFDIDPFVLALVSASNSAPFDEYYAQWPDCNPLLADIDADGTVNLFDIDPFVDLLTGG